MNIAPTSERSTDRPSPGHPHLVAFHHLRARVLLTVAIALGACALPACTTSTADPDASSGPDAGQPDASVSDAGPLGMDSAVPPIDGGNDAGIDAGAGCGPECPIGACVDGVCIAPTSCCDTGFCPRGTECSFDCTCEPLTGCCAGEPCPGTDLCDWSDCTCFSEDDCCRGFGCREAGESCNADCTCEVDISCAPACTGEFYCEFGTCRPRCAFDGVCEDPALVCERDLGCILPFCTGEACALGEPPQTCDPFVGCDDPCAHGDWSWCTSAGGRCLLGQCVEDACSMTGVGCHYRYDCWGNASCLPDDAPDPGCDPFGMTATPYQPPRPDLCVCGAFGGCVDTFGGGRIGPFLGPVPF